MNTNHKFNRMFANILSIAAILAIALPAMGSASALEPEPIIKISTSNNYLRADNFAPNTTVTFTVYTTQNTDEDPFWSDSRVTDDSGFAIIWPWDDPQPPDLVVGNYVVASDGINEKQLVLEPLTIDVFNPDTDFAAGTASPGDSIWVVVGNDEIGYPAGILAEANANGIWTADFAEVYDFSNDMWGSAEVGDNDGDVTVYHLGPTPTPWLIAFPENDAVEAWEWPDGATVYLTIDNAPEGFMRERTAEVTTWGDPRTYIRFDFAGEDGYDLQVGDMVALTDQFGQSTTHEVQSLSITGVDQDTNIVTGTAETDAQLQVWAHEQSAPPVDVPIADDGTWQADLTDVFDITYGTGGRAWVVEGINATAVDWYVPNPHFTVFPEWEWFDGNDWPNGSTVTITVAGKPECTTSKESWGYFFNGNFGEGCDVEFGDEVTFTDGITTRTHNVRTLYVTDVDIADNTVRGKAKVEAGTIVYVWPHDAWFEPLQAIVDESGEWQVNLGDAGYTLRDDSQGRAEIRDEMGNATAEDWHVTHPRFTVFPEWEWFDGNDWPNGSTVAITVAGKPECTTSKESWGYFFNGNFGEGCDVEFGDEVTFTEGTTTRTHTVRNLAITKVNQEDNIIKGTADAGTEVHVWPHATGQEQLATTSPQGKWNIDFTEVYDLVTGDAGRAEIRDEAGNSTAVDWNVSSPRLVAFPAVDQILGYYWPEGSIVNLSINDKHIAKATVQGAPWDPNDITAFFDFGGLHNLVAGDVVMLSGHDMEIYYTVQNLTVTVANEIENTVIGTADPGVNVMVYPYDYGNQPLQVTADENGDWFANFEDIGIDLLPGMCGRSDIFDEFNNSTTVDWCIPNPTFVAYLPYAVEGYDWPMGDEISLTINDVSYPSAVSEQRPDFPEGTTRVLFDVGQYGITLQANDHIVMTDEALGVAKDVVVTNLAVMDFDLDALTVSGVYDPAYDLWVWLYDREGQVPVTNPDNGTWIATFSELPPGVWGGATQWDGDGDGTSLDFQVPDARVVIVNQEDWVNSGITVSAGQSFTIEALGLMNPCSDTYANGADYCIFYTPEGAEGVVPDENEFGTFPGPGLRFMALLGRIGDGEPFYIGAGGTFTAEGPGVLWFTPNDNLRTDNQGAYSVLVWLEP